MSKKAKLRDLMVIATILLLTLGALSLPQSADQQHPQGVHAEEQRHRGAQR